MERLLNFCRKQRHLEIIFNFLAILIALIGAIVIISNYNDLIQWRQNMLLILVVLAVVLVSLCLCAQIARWRICKAINVQVASVLEEELAQRAYETSKGKSKVISSVNGYTVYIKALPDAEVKRCVYQQLVYLFGILQRTLKKRITICWH